MEVSADSSTLSFYEERSHGVGLSNSPELNLPRRSRIFQSMKQLYFNLPRLDLPEFELFLAITGSSFDEKQNVAQYSHRTSTSLTLPSVGTLVLH